MARTKTTKTTETESVAPSSTIITPVVSASVPLEAKVVKTKKTKSVATKSEVPVSEVTFLQV